jgi:glucose/arabinose dehydrogenase
LLITALFSCQQDEVNKISVPETNEQPTSSVVTGNVFEPALVPATADRIAQLKVPAGFTITKYADQLGKPRQLAVTSSGNVYVSDRTAGTVTLLRDTNGDGVAETKQTVATLKNAHGLTVHANQLYIVTVNELYVADMNADGTISQPRQLINDLPDAGQHANRTIAFGPDGMLYITVGSTCNACEEPNPENATILRANPDGTGRTIFAKGLRNTIGFGWHPQTGEMFGFDHGIDWLGDEQQGEEINLIKQGAEYGWPYLYGQNQYNPHPRPTQGTYADYAAKSTKPLLEYDPHAAPLAWQFYAQSQFPAEYQNDAFVTMRGSWNRTKPSGYKVVRVHFENGKPTRVDDFVTGFLVNNNQAQFGRPVGIATLSDGSLIFSEDNNGVIYRVSYK